MSVIDILTRVDEICKKYERYDVEKLNAANVHGNDAFAHLYASVESDIESALQVLLLSVFSFCWVWPLDQCPAVDVAVGAESGDGGRREESGGGRGVECRDPTHQGAVVGGDSQAAEIGRQERLTHPISF
ncbi:hypothetical protein BHM03_00005419 [Ensete ventricosum]|nr:hypothetical protein BHM03_00005419 [Ensete ventricosum]